MTDYTVAKRNDTNSQTNDPQKHYINNYLFYCIMCLYVIYQ